MSGSGTPAVRPARIRTAVSLAAGSLALGWTGLDWWARDGREPLPLPWTAVVGTAALAIAVVAAGLPVRRWLRGGAPAPVNPLVAARTVVLAKAAAYGGAILAGWYGAQALEVIPDLVGARRTRFTLALLAAASAIAVSIAGLVVQQWCRVPPGDDDSRPTDHAQDS